MEKVYPNCPQIPFVGVTTAARKIGIAPRTLYYWARRGKIRFVRTIDGQQLFDAAHVARLAIEARDNPPRRGGRR